ncbi:MAG TPA: hypothetical protein VK934_05170 [Fimbriimonas sp.]|nr:hypothetical protein [Fimbriimonas sp.]
MVGRYLCCCTAALGIGCSGAELGSGPSNFFPTSVQRLHASSQGLLLYLQDHDDFAPVANTWIDVLTPYVENVEVFNSPALSQYGYALNAEVAGSTAIDPSLVVGLFDSTIVERNATASVSTMPQPPRYDEGNTIAFLDGHVEHEVPILFTGLDGSKERIGRLGTAALMYAGDSDDVLPIGSWAHGLWPYLATDRAFRSPIFDAPSQNYGYAMNQELVGQSFAQIESPATAILFFDSTDLARDAVAATVTRPSPGRYEGFNTWVYADGTVSSG